MRGRRDVTGYRALVRAITDLRKNGHTVLRLGSAVDEVEVSRYNTQIYTSHLVNFIFDYIMSQVHCALCQRNVKMLLSTGPADGSERLSDVCVCVCGPYVRVCV